MKTKSTSILAAGLFAASALSAQVAFIGNPNPGPGDRGVFAFWSFNETAIPDLSPENINTIEASFGDATMDNSQFGPIPGSLDPLDETGAWTFVPLAGNPSTTINLPAGESDTGYFRVRTQSATYDPVDSIGSYIEFTFSMEGLKDLRIDNAQTANTPLWNWSYSTNGVDFTDFGPPQTHTAAANWALAPGAETSALDGVETAFLRWTVEEWGTRNMSNLTFTATAVPEPAVFGLLMGMGALGLVVSRRRRSRV